MVLVWAKLMPLSFSVSFFSLFRTCFCSMCVLSNWQTDLSGDVSSFSLSSFSLHFSSHHSLRHLWRLRLKSEWERQRRNRGAQKRVKENLFCSYKELSCAVDKRGGLWRRELEDLLKCSVIFFSSDNVNGGGDVLSLCGVLLDFSADSYCT